MIVQNKIFLITGGAGFIGSALIKHIINNTNHSVINIDKLSYSGNLQSLESIETNERYIFEQADICNGEIILKIIQKYQPDIVMHLAAESHVDRSIDEPIDFIQNNIFGTFNLLEKTKNYWQLLKGEKKDNFRFLYVSTDEVYGDLDGKDSFFTEESKYNPSSPYSASKASSDHLVRAWYRTYSLPVIITHCSNNYGPFQFPEKLIPHIILNAIKGNEIPVYGNGKQIRDWLYVDDHVQALMIVALNANLGETYDIGGHNEIQNIEVVNKVCSILDSLVPKYLNGLTTFSELITYVKDRPGHDLRYAIDSRKIRKDFGWKPLEDFDSGIQKTVEWYLNNMIWSENIQNGEYKLGRLGVSFK
jgi:dTDP-glucose 4,6-dehydratase